MSEPDVITRKGNIVVIGNLGNVYFSGVIRVVVLLGNNKRE